MTPVASLSQLLTTHEETRTPSFALVVALAAACASCGVFYTFGLFSPMLMADRDFSLVTINILFGLAYAGSTIGVAPLVRFLAPTRTSAVGIMVACCVVLPVAWVALALSRSTAVAAIAFIAIGMGVDIIFTVALLVLPKDGIYPGVMSTSYGLGGAALGYAVVKWPGGAPTLRTLFLAMAALLGTGSVVTLAALVWYRVRYVAPTVAPTPGERAPLLINGQPDGRDDTTTASPLRHPVFLALLVLFFVSAGLGSTIAADFGLIDPRYTAAHLTIVFSVAQTVGRLAFTALVGITRTLPSWILTLSAGCYLLSAILLMIPTPLPLASIIAASVAFGGLTAVLPSFTERAIDSVSFASLWPYLLLADGAGSLLVTPLLGFLGIGALGYVLLVGAALMTLACAVHYRFKASASSAAPATA